MTQRYTLSTAVLLAIATIAPYAHAADLSREQSDIQRAVDEAKRKQQSGQKYSLQSVDPTLDRNLQGFASAANSLMSCANSKQGFGSQFGAQISQVSSIFGNVTQLLNNPALKALVGGAMSGSLSSANSVVGQLTSTCHSFGSAVAGAANAKYDQVSQVMKSVFSGGDLSPSSRAVHHAADVDMPARGGTPESLRAYLNSQNGQVKQWYRTNFGLR